MNKVILQLWEESTKDKEPTPDGCSIHIDIIERDKYVSKIYESRIGQKVPKTYERIVGPPVEAFIEDGVLLILKDKKNIKLTQIELNNLVRFEEILTKEI